MEWYKSSVAGWELRTDETAAYYRHKDGRSVEFTLPEWYRVSGEHLKEALEEKSDLDPLEIERRKGLNNE